MTIQEAINDIIQNIKPSVGGESLNLAIEALYFLDDSRSLKTIPCEASLDYESEYYRLKERYELNCKENQELKQTIVNMAVKIHRD